MRALCSDIFCLITLFSLFTFSKAFNINALPLTVTASQVVGITWTRAQNDPTSFQFAKSIAGLSFLGLIGPTQSVRTDEFQGTATATFIDPGRQVTIVAYDIDKNKDTDLGDPNVSKPAPFFQDPNLISIAEVLPTIAPTTSQNGSETTDQISPSQPTTNPSSHLSSGASETASQTLTTSSKGVTVGAIASASTTLPDSGVTPSRGSGNPSFSMTGSIGVKPPTTSTQVTPHSSPTTKLGVIVGVTVGGLVGLATIFIILFLKRRSRRHKNTSDLTPFPTTSLISSPTTLEVHKSQEKEAINEQNEDLECQLDEYDIVSQGSHTGDEIMTNTNGPNEGGDTVQSLRCHVDVLNQRIATLEAELAPPDYSSRAGSA